MSTALDFTITPRERDIGGFSVRRSLPDSRRRLVGPFIFFDHMGPARFEPGEGMEVRAHPHIGLATVTYLFDGRIRHRDSLGYDQEITPGAVNWMTAGRGVVHSERTPPTVKAAGSSLHGIQVWVALPREAEECEPAFDHYPADRIPGLKGDGAAIRVILGDAFGVSSPVSTASETLYAELRVQAGSSVDIESTAREKAVYVVEGAIDIEGATLDAGTMGVLHDDSAPGLCARENSLVMLLGGAPIDGRRFIWWNFVSSSKERIERAKDDWRESRFDPIEGETEFIRLPED